MTVAARITCETLPGLLRAFRTASDKSWGGGLGTRLDCVLMIFTSVLYTFYRVWRYRGGRDGHETLQQFMNFLGRGKEVQLESGTQQGQSHCTTAGRI